MLNFLLRCMFIVILAYILVSSFFSENIIEGLETKKKKQFATYKKDPIQMATKNEENIKVLREELNSIKKISEKASKLTKMVDDNSNNIDGLIKQQEAQVKASGLVK